MHFESCSFHPNWISFHLTHTTLTPLKREFYIHSNKDVKMCRWNVLCSCMLRVVRTPVRLCRWIRETWSWSRVRSFQMTDREASPFLSASHLTVCSGCGHLNPPPLDVTHALSWFDWLCISVPLQHGCQGDGHFLGFAQGLVFFA